MNWEIRIENREISEDDGSVGNNAKNLFLTRHKNIKKTRKLKDVPITFKDKTENISKQESKSLTKKKSNSSNGNEVIINNINISKTINSR